MAKEEWGVKRLCPTTGKRFYDMGRDPVVSPYTGEVVTLDTGKNQNMIADKADPETAKMETADIEDDAVLDDDDAADVDLGDDVLEDDDDDSVSLDDIADVASDDDDS
ncbi:TIGR02300 family protein [Pseudaestuariivita rosea]|uniref:TIGR02300 family protein n=1 Tax=Pseudaestuariivita rosea TaxID=2763263 RepID=UPI001ABAEB4F|nr:TIGR02300 family protein [Pseudaestuariivita rosea]